MRVKRILSRWLILLTLVQLTAIPASLGDTILRSRHECPPDEVFHLSAESRKNSSMWQIDASRCRVAAERNDAFTDLCHLTTSLSCPRETKDRKSFQRETWASWALRIHGLLLGFSSIVGFIWKFSSAYGMLLESRPVLIKGLSASFIGVCGDGLAQMTEQVLGDKKGKGKEDSSKEQVRIYSVHRGLASAAEGLFVSGPLMHFVYEFLEELIPVNAEATGAMKWFAATVQVSIDTLVMDPVFVAAMFVIPAVLEGRGRELPQIMRANYLRAVKTSWLSSVFFFPVQCVAFRFLRVEVRVLAMNIRDVLWDGMMSYLSHQRARH